MEMKNAAALKRDEAFRQHTLFGFAMIGANASFDREGAFALRLSQAPLADDALG